MRTGYSYTILRYVHDTATGEFANVGVALLAPDVRFAGALFRTTYGRLTRLFPGMDGDAFRGLMRFVQSRFDEIGGRLREELPLDSPPRSVLDLARSVLPRDDSSLQWSSPGSGLTDDPAATLERLYERLVTVNDAVPAQESRSDEDIWRRYKRPLESANVLKHLRPKKIAVQDDEVEFGHAWKNGVWHCLEPVSLDLAQAAGIRDKAHRWLGRITSVKETREAFKVYLLLGKPRDAELRDAYAAAVSILNKLPVDKEIVAEEEADAFSRRFAAEILRHERSGDSEAG